MKKFVYVMICSLFVCGFSNADDATGEVAAFKIKVDKHIDEDGPLGNGDYSWNKYRVSSFDVKKAVKSFEKLNARNAENGISCSMTVSTGVKTSIESLGENADPSVSELLLDLQKKGLIKEIVANE